MIEETIDMRVVRLEERIVHIENMQNEIRNDTKKLLETVSKGRGIGFIIWGLLTVFGTLVFNGVMHK